MSPRFPFLRAWPSLSFALLMAFLLILWAAGGSTRADAPGQAVVRGAAAAALLLAALFSERPQERFPRPVSYLLLATILLVLAQLIPLPPTWWQSLPGRSILLDATAGDQPWRAFSIQPSATVNAAASLLIPLTTLVLATGLPHKERDWMPAVLLGLITASGLVGLMQFSGTPFDNPLANDSVGAVSGMFANRNHFALFMAMGCLIVPVWALGSESRAWRIAMAFGLIIFFLLLILASGSRAGMVVGVVGFGIGLLIARKGLARALRRMPRWARLTGPVIGFGIVAAFVLASVATDRAQSINRIMALDAAHDMRARALPTTLSMISAYSPFGTGFGSFATAFRMHEPFELLKPTYFNHAHNDFLEVVIDGGVPALLLLAAALGWWAFASVRIWRIPTTREATWGRLGSALLLLAFIASLFDYPARTPIMMAIIVWSAACLSWGTRAQTNAAFTGR
jgi:O-antigen ligase